MLFLFATVWATDAAALYAGRYFGGPKLAPKISPAKTWSGAIGGALAGIAGGIALLAVMRFEFGAVHFLVALAVTAVAQLGDLFESRVKRRFSVKDTSEIIPGHGGLMDRLDGFIAAALVAAIFGILRAGPAAPAQGLAAMVTRVTILGATGSIGASALDLLRRGGGRYEVGALDGQARRAEARRRSRASSAPSSRWSPTRRPIAS